MELISRSKFLVGLMCTISPVIKERFNCLISPDICLNCHQSMILSSSYLPELSSEYDSFKLRVTFPYKIVVIMLEESELEQFRKASYMMELCFFAGNVYPCIVTHLKLAFTSIYHLVMGDIILSKSNCEK